MAHSFLTCSKFTKMIGPTTTAPWISVDDALPDMPFTCGIYLIAYNGMEVKPLLYERAIARKEIVYRWKYPWNRIYDGPKITHWMPLPELPANTERS